MDFQRFFSFSNKSLSNRSAAAIEIEPAPHQENVAERGYNIQLRRARLGDLPALTDLLTDSFHSSANQPFWLLPLLRFSIQEDLRQRLQHSPKNHACWVALRVPQIPNASLPPKLVGTIELGLRSPLTLSWPLNLETWLAPNQNILYISNLAVASKFRRQGIAQQLLQRCEQTAITWRQPSLYLHVLENNQAARNLYHLAGFSFERVDPSLESMLFNRDRRQLWRKQLSPQL